MAKFYGSSPGENSNVGPSGCRPVSGSGAHAWDPIGIACWGAVGVRINITSTVDGYHGGMERINWWMSQDATVASVPNKLGLQGAVI